MPLFSLEVFMTLYWMITDGLLKWFANPWSCRAERRSTVPCRRFSVEGLESRCLMSGLLTGVPFTSLFPQPVEGSPFTG